MHHLYQEFITVAPAEILGGFSGDQVLPGTPKIESESLLIGQTWWYSSFSAMPFLFVGTMSSLFSLLCLKLGSMDFFQSLLYQIGCSPRESWNEARSVGTTIPS